MRLTQYFLPIIKENPKEAEIISHRLMLRAGLIRQSSAGIYTWLPLGLQVLQKIEQIVREEQVRAGAVEVLMPNHDWQRYRDRGETPLANGSVLWSTVEYICRCAPDVNIVLTKAPPDGHVYAFVMAAGGVSVYVVPHTGIRS